MFDDLPLRKNLLANFAGRLWASGISLVFIPLYIRFMGIESYGLIGVYLSLMALVSVLDMGLSTTLNRELARLSTVPGNEQEARDLVRSMEAVYWGIGLLVALATILLAPLVPRYWVNPKGVTAETVQRAVMIMGFVIAFDWPAALYTGGLMGLQRQVQLNSIRAGMGTLQAVGAVLILWLVSPTISAYFLWQIVVAVAQTTTLAVVLWSNLPPTNRKMRFQRGLLTKNWKFTAGVSGITVLATILTQADKVILAKMLSLEAFGYYVLAYNVASSLTLLASPHVFRAFPQVLPTLCGKERFGTFYPLSQRMPVPFHPDVFPCPDLGVFFERGAASMDSGRRNCGKDTPSPERGRRRHSLERPDGTALHDPDGLRVDDG